MKLNEKGKILPVLTAALGNIIWGLSFLFIRTALTYADSHVMLAHRFCIATLVMAGYLLITGKRITLKGKDRLSLMLLVLFQAAYFVFETLGLMYSNTTISGLVLAVVPIPAIVTGMLFLKEYPSRQQVLLCLLPVAGIILMTVSGNELGALKPLGILFLLCAVISSAMYKTVNRKSAQDFTSYERTFFVLLSSSVVFTLFGMHSVQWDIGTFFAPLANVEYSIAVLFLSLLCSIAANLLVNYASGRMSVLKMSSFGALSTLTTMLTGVLLLHEPMNLGLFLGAALILIGIQQLTAK